MVVEALPTLIHLSVSLFFAGLVVFLWNVDLTIFKVVLSWISVCTALYGCITLILIFRHDSPYYSPLTRLVQPVVVVILFVFTVLYVCLYGLVVCCSLLFWERCRGLVRIVSHPYSWFIRVMNLAFLTPEEAVLKSSLEIDIRAFTWTFDCLDEDHELDRFFSGLPGFHNTRMLKEPLHGLEDREKLRLLEAAIGLLDRTLSSNVLPDQVKRQRVDICTNAIDLVVTPDAFLAIVLRFASEDRYGPAQSTEIVDFVKRWNDREDQNTTLVQAIFSIVVARVPRHDDSWFNLAFKELGIPETVLREYAAHGDSLSLAVLINVTRQQFTHIRNPSWPSKAISDVLRAASKFNTQDTSLELQHEFCALWNQIVRDAQKGSSKIPEHVLGPIRTPYIALHQDTNSAPTQFSSTTGDSDINLWVPDTYPVCNISDHIHDNSASQTCIHDVLHDDAALSPASPASPVAPLFPLPVPLPIDNSLATAPLLGNSLPIHQTAKSFCVSVTSPDQAAASAMRDTVTLGIATPLPTPETSTSTPPLFSTSLSDSDSLRHSTNVLAPPCPPNFPSLVSSNTGFGNKLDTGPSLCSHSPITHLITRNSYPYSQRFSRADLYDTAGCYSRE